MRNVLCFCNRQQTRRIDLRLLRRITSALLTDLLRPRKFEIGVHLVGNDEITQLNQRFLKHAGSTDVITFDYSDETEEIVRPFFVSGHDWESQRNGLGSGSVASW